MSQDSRTWFGESWLAGLRSARCEIKRRLADQQCAECKLWFPSIDPKSDSNNPQPCLDGQDADGVMSHVSGKPAVHPICIFCDSPDGDNTHATLGVVWMRV